MIIDHQICGWFVKWTSNVYCLFSRSELEDWKNFLSFVTSFKINLHDQSNKEKIRDKALALLGHNLSEHGQTLYTTLYTLHYTYLNYFYLNIEVVEARKASEPDLAGGLEPRVSVSRRGGPLVQFLMSVDGGGGGGGGPGEALVLITRSRAADWWLCSVPTLSLLSPS